MNEVKEAGLPKCLLVRASSTIQVGRAHIVDPNMSFTSEGEGEPNVTPHSHVKKFVVATKK